MEPKKQRLQESCFLWKSFCRHRIKIIMNRSSYDLIVFYQPKNSIPFCIAT